MILPPLEISTIFGLPLHPLVVHAAVVLVPLSAAAFLAVGWNRRWRQAYYLPVTLLALGGGFAAFLADQTGEPLQETVRRTGQRVGEHPEQGGTAMAFAMIFAGACLAVLALQRFGPQIRQRLGLQDRLRLPFNDDTALFALVVPLAALAIVTMAIAGHSGAKLVWSDVSGRSQEARGLTSPPAGATLTPEGRELGTPSQDGRPG